MVFPWFSILMSLPESTSQLMVRCVMNLSQGWTRSDVSGFPCSLSHSATASASCYSVCTWAFPTCCDWCRDKKTLAMVYVYIYIYRYMYNIYIYIYIYWVCGQKRTRVSKHLLSCYEKRPTSYVSTHLSISMILRSPSLDAIVGQYQRIKELKDKRGSNWCSPKIYIKYILDR